MGSGASGASRFFGAAVAVLLVAGAAGFFLPPLMHPGPSAPPAPQTPANPSDAASPPVQPPSPAPAPAATGGQFTAPNAPQIAIVEQKPTVKPKPAAKPRDSEASQTGVLAGTTKTVPTDSNGLITNPSTDSTPPPAPTPVEPSVSTPTDTTPSPQSPAPAPTQPAPAATSDGGSSDEGGTVYHVLVGNNFINERNAKIFASALRHRGYVAVTESVNSVDGIKYKVQVGAFHNKVSAEQEASQLQASGYPAYVAIAQDR